MSISAVKDQRGFPRACCICDKCSFEEIVPAPHEASKDGQPMKVNEGKVVKKLTQMGWSKIRRTLLCPKCEAKRRTYAAKKSEHVVPEKWKAGGEKYPNTGDQMDNVTDIPRQPTRTQRREIMEMLAEVYDTDAGRYKGSETDDTVAGALEVMPGWVSQIREEFFGDEGGNCEVDDLAAECRAMAEKLDGQIKEATEVLGQARKSAQAVQDMQVKLDAIRKALSPRVLARAGK